MRGLLLSTLLVALITPAFAQDARPDTLYPSRSPLGSIWRVVLAQYLDGRERTEADVLKRSTSATGLNVGKWRKGSYPRVLLLSVEGTEAVVDTTWAKALVADSLVDSYCGSPPEQCPGEYVTLFLTLSPPASVDSGKLKVQVSERALSPSRCQREPETFTGFMDKTFILRQQDSAWAIVGRELGFAGSGPCR